MTTRKQDPMAAWLKRQGMSSPEEARGDTVLLTDQFIDDSEESEMKFLSVEVTGATARMYDLYGWEEKMPVAKLREWVAKHGKLKTWEQFQSLGSC